MTDFVLDRPALDRLIETYEALREQDGMGTMLYRVTPRQRIDALQIFEAVGGLGHAPRGDQRGFWLRYLRPVLAETREQAALLERAFVELAPRGGRGADGGAGGDTQRRSDDGRPSGGRTARDVALRIAAVAVALVLAVLAGVAIYTASDTTPIGPTTSTRVIPGSGAGGGSLKPENGGDLRAAAYAQALTLTMAIADRYGDALTPYALAANYAGARPSLGEPATILARMLRKIPLPAYAPIPRTPFGAMALRAYAAQTAALTLGHATASFEPLLFDDTRYAGESAPKLQAFAQSGATASAYASPPVETWPWWTEFIPFLILLPGAAWAFSGRRTLVREVVAEKLRATGGARRSARRARAGERGARYALRTSLGRAPELPPARQTMRTLMKLRDPRPGRRLDANRSLRATLASAGDVVSVMRPASRAIDFLFLVRRDSVHDHARARALRIINALSDAGVAVTAYDYAQDPRMLTATSRAAGETRAAPRSLDLRGLWELHADALLVIVTDGDDLIDGIAGKPYPFVETELRRWPRRMLLTPTPIAEWGEREMRLAFALDAPVGRATMAGFADLGLGLAPDAPDGRPRKALEAALVETGYLARIARWSAAAAIAIAPDETPPRPGMVSVGGAALLIDASPGADEQAELVASVRSWLGPSFFWFAACGLYPQMRVDLTLWLGQRLRRYGHPRNAPLFSEAALERLCLLPWFRAGFMPDWLRKAAFEALSERERTMAREAIAELLAGRIEASERQESGLAVWQASWRGQPLAADDVMLEIVDFESEAPLGRDAIATDGAVEARRRWRNRGLVRLAGLCGWAALACWLWPSPADAPHPQGAWWPLIGFFGSSALLSASVVAPWTRALWDVIPQSVGRAEKRVDVPPPGADDRMAAA